MVDAARMTIASRLPCRAASKTDQTHRLRLGFLLVKEEKSSPISWMAKLALLKETPHANAKALEDAREDRFVFGTSVLGGSRLREHFHALSHRAPWQSGRGQTGPVSATARCPPMAGHLG